MRVIAGKYKGRSLVAPKSDTRPTLDRTKETLFNILNFKLRGSVVLDLFAGSGQLAIESLSRGAERVILCDNSRDAVAAVKANFAKIGETADLYSCDYQQCLSRVKTKFDIVFVDPPYQSCYYLDVLSKLAQFDLLNDDGIVVCEHSRDCDIGEANGYILYDSRKIGTVEFSFYKRNAI
ncbi:MAG: 16S rRNA (guanine(966)-N(2))-methyltransferase RsmD [Corallococcus sp.]|nr:16S rRNA (guanine(966)-N(2))-methyltransferase RsmD [Corallococcus sp.]